MFLCLSRQNKNAPPILCKDSANEWNTKQIYLFLFPSAAYLMQR